MRNVFYIVFVQIRNFFEEIANPVLKNVTFEYPSHKTKDLTETRFSMFLGGSELVVAGKFDPSAKPETNPVSEELDIMPVVPMSASAGFIISGQVRIEKYSV